MDKIKVLECCDAYYPNIDGVVSVVNNYTREINKQNTCYVCAPKPKKKDKYIEKPDFKVLRCKSVSAPENYRCALPFLDRKFKKAIKNEHFDIIHTHSPFLMGRCMARICKKQGIPLCATLHTQYHRDFERTLGKHNPLVKFMIGFIRRSFNKADSVWTVSNRSGDYLRQYGYKGEIKVIRNATDYVYPENAQELIGIIDKKHNTENQKNLFVFVGRMAMYKNLGLLCDALKILKDKGEDFKMIFVGGGFDFNKLVAYSKQIGVDDKCIFTGDVRDRSLLQGYYLRADLLLFPSTFDMASIVQVEASAHKTPAVVVKGSCSAEQIIDNENGFLCEESAQSLGEKLEELCHNPQLVKTVGENAYKTLYRTWDDLGKEVVETYKQVIADYKAKHNK